MKSRATGGVLLAVLSGCGSAAEDDPTGEPASSMVTGHGDAGSGDGGPASAAETDADDAATDGGSTPTADGSSADPSDGSSDATGDDPPGTESDLLYYGREVTVTAEVGAHMQAVAERAPRDESVFLKAGDSITAGTGPYGSFGCFASAEGVTVDLAGAEGLDTTVQWFDQTGLGSGQTSWNRESTAALAGAGTAWLTEGGDESPLQAEIDATDPRFAVVMMGTNDVAGPPEEYGLGAYGRRQYAANLWRAIERLEANGVVPLITYIPPVNTEDDPQRTWIARDFVAIARALATAVKIPTIDFNTPMDALGLPAYPDGIHPASHPQGGCLFGGDGLEYGYNIRNRVSLEVLDKARRAVVEGVAAVDPDPPALLGAGTTAQPYQITELPFALGVEFEGREDGPNDYSACGAHAGATGPAMVFSLEVDEPTPIRVLAVPTTGECVAAQQFNDCNDSTDIVVAVYEDEIIADHCLYAHSTVVDGPLTPGHTYYVVVDSYGEADLALLSVHRCHPDDPSCS